MRRAYQPVVELNDLPDVNALGALPFLILLRCMSHGPVLCKPSAVS